MKYDSLYGVGFGVNIIVNPDYPSTFFDLRTVAANTAYPIKRPYMNTEYHATATKTYGVSEFRKASEDTSTTGTGTPFQEYASTDNIPMQTVAQYKKAAGSVYFKDGSTTTGKEFLKRTQGTVVGVTAILDWNKFTGIRSTDKAGHAAIADIASVALGKPVQSIQVSAGKSTDIEAWRLGNTTNLAELLQTIIGLGVVSNSTTASVAPNGADKYLMTAPIMLVLDISDAFISEESLAETFITLANQIRLFSSTAPARLSVIVVTDNISRIPLSVQRVSNILYTEPKPLGGDDGEEFLAGLRYTTAMQVFASAEGESEVTSESVSDILRRRSVARYANSDVLRVLEPDVKFSDLVGMEGITAYLKAIHTNGKMPKVLVFMDEIEKTIGTGMDTSGVSQSLLGTFLQWFGRRNMRGLLMVGHAGTAKSVTCRAMANEFGMSGFALSIDSAKSRFVGQSEANMRAALDSLDIVSNAGTSNNSGADILVIATCNNLGAMPPELVRRFNWGTWYTPLPDSKQRWALLDKFCKQYAVDSMEADIFLDNPYTGAEIEAAVRMCAESGLPLERVAEMVSCYGTVHAPRVTALNTAAHSRWVDVGTGKLYTNVATGNNNEY